MALDLVTYLKSGEGSPRLWVNFNEYTKKLLLGDGENPWTSPAAYMSFYGQAHGLVKADVVVLDVWDLFQHWMEEDDKAIPSMAEKGRLTYALKVMLEAFAPRELLAEVITAVSNNYRGSTPIVLVVPSPRSLLVKAHKAATGNNAEPEEMAIDTAGMYLADFLRYFSETELSGVLLVEDEELMPASTEELSWYQPVFNITKHYRWSVGIQLPFSGDGFNVPGDVDFAITPAASAISADTLGVDISQPLWQGDEIVGKGNGFYYFSIPADSKPESVLDTISTLKS
tara:strand:- start:44309 stop:45163 length:855 start_codon:yes stop_codon:yes gene_type:complete